MGFLSKLFGLGSSSEEIKKALEKGAKIIDVRTSAEFASGHPKGAINIPVDQISGNISKIKSYKTPVVLCCASGMRSARATSILKEVGVEAYNAGPWTNLK
jgi:rhodanese-related sulfurtransferase